MKKSRTDNNKSNGVIATGEERRRLMQSWVMELASSLMTEYGMTRRVAVRQAYMTRDLLEWLGRGKVWFAYRKADGTTRRAWGTLCKGVTEDFDSYQYKGEADAEAARDITTVRYWDIDARGFRSFKAARLLLIDGAIALR